MRIPVYYTLMVLIWGSTWYGIKLQLGVVPPEVSLVYRFVAASAILLVLAMFSAKRRVAAEHLPWIALQGAMMFGLNYILVYYATELMSSGLVATVFTTTIFINAFNERLFFGVRLQPLTLLAALLGMAGVGLLFFDELLNMDEDSIRGILFCMGAALVVSCGSMVSIRNMQAGLDIIPLNAYAMTAGSLMMLAYVLIRGVPFAWDPSPVYVGSLAYLVVFGTVITFTMYLAVIRAIGATRTAYSTVLLPLVALGISTWLEGYTWDLAAIGGVGLILAGTLMLLLFRSTDEQAAEEQP